jgi:DNA-binding beta-propeller fold protein YncE
MRNDVELPSMPPEPFNLALAGDSLIVTHFTTGFVSLVSAPARLDAEPLLQDTITTLWVASRITGLYGAAAVAPRPNDPSGLFYVTSRQEARVATVGVAKGGTDYKDRPLEALVRSEWFFLQGLEQPGLPGDVRGVVFSGDGDRMYLTSRTPNSLMVFDTSLDERGAPRNVPLGALEICSQPANLAVVDFGAGPRVAVPCFVDGQVWLIDGASMRIISVEDAGRGPNGVVASAAHKKIFIGNYAEDTITVIDADPASATQNRAVLRLGVPRTIEGQD